MSLYILSLLPIPVEMLIVGVMHRRKQHTLFPAFWAYLCFQVMTLGAESFLSVSPYERAYFCVYWGSGFASIAFTLLVLREVFAGILESYSALTRFRRVGYEVMLTIIWMAALYVSVQTVGEKSLVRKIAQMQQAVSFCAVGMLLFVVAASIVLGIRWRTELCGIASGIGLLGTIDLVVFSLSLYRGHYDAKINGQIETIGYDLAVAIFAIYFLRSNAGGKYSPPRHDLLDWVGAMKETLSK